MEEDRFVATRENPRNLGFLPERGLSTSSSANKGMPSDLVQKPAPPILDRFRAMLKEREEELRVSDEDDVPAPIIEEVVQLYEVVLSELTFNSKPIITELTIIAGEHREYGEGIADAICDRIMEVPVDQKLPSLYLLDSIVKNIGREYVKYFASRLPEVFCEAYKQVHSNLHPAMRHLFGTWAAVFPPSVLCKIEAELQFSPSVNRGSSGLTVLRTSESPRPTHGIHVNPKYLEARRQFECSAAVGARRLGSPGSAAYTPYAGAENLFPLSKTRVARPSSPSRMKPNRSLSPPVEEFSVDNFPRSFVRRASPCHSGIDYGIGKVADRDGERSDLWTKHWFDGRKQLEAPAVYNLSNGNERQRPRALIDAYGNDRGNNNSLKDKPLKVEQLDVNSIKKKTETTWQNTEEEEYVWEDMSPTLADRSRANNLLASNASRRLSVGNVSAITAEDGVPVLGSHYGSLSKTSLSGLGTRNEIAQVPASRYSQEPWNFHHHFPQLSQQHLSSKARGMNFQVSLSASGIAPQIGQKMPPMIDNFSERDAQFQRFSTVTSRIGSSGADCLNVDVLSTVTPASVTEKHRGRGPRSPPTAQMPWPPVNATKSHPRTFLSSFPQQKQSRSQFNLMDAGKPVVNQGPNKSSVIMGHQLDVVERQGPTSMLHLPSQQPGLVSANLGNQGQASFLQQQLLHCQEARESFGPSVAANVSSHLTAPPLNRGSTPQGNLSNPIPGMSSSVMTNTSLQLPGGTLPHLPPGAPPASFQMGTLPQNAGSILSQPPPGNAFSGLISSLVAQGLLSFTKPASVQDSVGVEFDPDLLKVRHESAITALYADLPRQCTTCGLRFKCQEEHSSHMDWHVTKNRISKNRKQKPSRKWFVSASVWLSTAEALGTDAVPGFLPTEDVVERKDDEELAVPADEDQNVCALCGEPFDDFYSDETEEWMYKGAVYMNAPDGSTAGMDRSQLGPIVHAKCRSESAVVSPEDFGRDEGENDEVGSQRKRMRS